MFDAPSPGSNSEAEPVVEPTEALNGAQITSLVTVLQSVAGGEMPRDSAIEIITTAFPITKERAERIMGSIGVGFVPRSAQTPGVTQ